MTRPAVPGGGGGVRVLRRADNRQATDDLELPGPRYGFGVSWKVLPGRGVDIDLQCVVVDAAGAIIDCAYYNNLKAVRSITHSGDEAAGKPDGIAEMVWVNVKRLPPQVRLLVFVVAAYSGGSLGDVADGTLHVMEGSEDCEIALLEMERSKGCVDVVAAMHRGPGGWSMRLVDLPAQSGQHFMDILPLLGQVIRGFVPDAPARQKVAFAMEKGGVVDLPRDLNGITVGLGWDVDDGECDLDVSAVLLDAAGADLEAVFFGRLESKKHGIRHSGDNLTGEGDGDDEQIVVSLEDVGQQVQQVIFVVNIYTPARTFRQVANPSCRVVDNASGDELCRYSLRDAGSEKGLIIARIAREAGGRWGFHALGLPCRGRTWKDSIGDIRRVTAIKTSSLALTRGASSDSIHSSPAGESGAPRAPKAAAPPPAASSSVCAVQ